jgi:aspartyl protease family protein
MKNAWKSLRYCSVALMLFTIAGFAHAQSPKVALVGLFPGKAVVVIDGQSPRTISAGQKQPEGVTLISTDSDRALFEINGKKYTIEMTQHIESTAGERVAMTVTIPPDPQGHYWITGQVNGRSIRFLVDTGATMVSLPASFARNAGIEYTKGQRATMQTANGPSPAFRVKVDSVTVGDIVLYQVDATVLESGLESALLGMTFLNRTDLKRDGQNMVLTKRY